MMVKNFRLIKILLLVFLISLFTSCHSNYLNLKIKTDGTIAWNKDSTAFAFVAKKRLYKMPKGIAKLSDGGKSKTEYLDFSIYKFDTITKKLTHITSLNNFYNALSYRWLNISQVQLSLNDTALYYKMSEASDYDLKNLKERSPQILEDIPKTYKINFHNHKKETVDTGTYNHLFDKMRERFNSSLAKHYLGNLKCSDWDITIKKIYPQSKDTYIDYIVEKQGNAEFKGCIFNQIAIDFTDKDHEKIIERMDKHKQLLYDKYTKYDEQKDPYRKSMAKSEYDDYIIYMKDIYKLLIK